MVMKEKTQTMKSRKMANREKIINAARELFIESDVESINMHQIAQRAMIGQATLYRHYDKMSDICAEIVSRECQVLIDETQDFLKNANKDISALNKVYQVIKSFISYLQPRVDWVCTVTRASTNYRPIQSPLYQWMRKILTELLIEADGKRELKNIDIAFAVEAILGTLNNIDDQLLYQEYTVERILQGIKDIYIDGFAKR